MHQVDCQELLKQDSPDAWVMAVLCDFNDRPARTVIHEILTRLTERLHEAPPRLREYVEMLEILSTNRDLNLNIEEELEMLTIELEKLPSYRIGERRGIQKGIETGIERGIEKGIEQGIEKGIERGIEKGIERGMAQGMEKGAYAKALAIASELLAAGFAPSQVAAFTQLSLEEVEALKKGKDA